MSRAVKHARATRPSAANRRSPSPLLALALWTLLAPAALGAQAAPGAPGAQGGTGQPGEGGDAPILPGDVVRLYVWREADLSGDFLVNQYGLVVLPRLGEYDVSDETHRSFRDRVIRDMRRTVENPAIEVVVLKKVRVLGEVRDPGVWHVDPTTTLADALALAGGTTPEARQGTVVLRRDGETVIADLRVETLVSDSRIRSGDELVVPERSWLDRNTNVVVSGGLAFVGLVAALIAR